MSEEEEGLFLGHIEMDCEDEEDDKNQETWGEWFKRNIRRLRRWLNGISSN